MARMARVVVPNYPHHITQRGNRRQKTFFCDEEDLIARHTQTGRPLGSANFVRTLEIISGEKLAPKRPGRKPVIRK